jgi:hypothetical protein
VQGKIDDDTANGRNEIKDMNMEQQADPNTMHIKPREPVIDDDFDISSIDREAAMFVVRSYEKAWVVDIDGIMINAGQLLRNVLEKYITEEVTFFQIYVVSKKTCALVIYPHFAGNKCICQFEQLRMSLHHSFIRSILKSWDQTGTETKDI